MAKCVIMFEGTYNGNIVRVPDKMARDIVDAGRGDYASKETWKELGRPELIKKGKV